MIQINSASPVQCDGNEVKIMHGFKIVYYCFAIFLFACFLGSIFYKCITIDIKKSERTDEYFSNIGH